MEHSIDRHRGSTVRARGPHEDRFRALVGPLVALVVAFVLGGILVALLGQNPFAVYALLLRGSLSGWPNLAVTLQLTTPLIFTGLAVAVAFRSGIWNIGVEGQMLMGALLAGIVGYAVPLPDALEVPACLLAAIVGGGPGPPSRPCCGPIWASTSSSSA